MSDNDFRQLIPSPFTARRFTIGDRELASGDSVEIQLGADIVRGRVEFDYALNGYAFVTRSGETPVIIPLQAGMLARRPAN